MATGITRTEKGITDRLDGMLNRSKGLRSFLNRNIYRMYQDVQKERWMTENVSEGTKWKENSSFPTFANWEPEGSPFRKFWPQGYAQYKLYKYQNAPLKGRSVMVATGDLFQSVIGPGKGFRKVIEDRSITILTSIPYAKDADDVRTFTTYSLQTRKRFRKAIAQFVFNNFLFDIQRVT
jgi:hypothetical protein